jgi:hypothetical protein
VSINDDHRPNVGDDVNDDNLVAKSNRKKEKISVAALILAT